jgi:hypothetical protein
VRCKLHSIKFQTSYMEFHPATRRDCARNFGAVQISASAFHPHTIFPHLSSRIFRCMKRYYKRTSPAPAPRTTTCEQCKRPACVSKGQHTLEIRLRINESVYGSADLRLLFNGNMRAAFAFRNQKDCYRYKILSFRHTGYSLMQTHFCKISFARLSQTNN